MLETVTRGDAHFSMTYLGSDLNHMLFAIGHLNVVYYFKCSINSELKWGLLGIIQTEPTIIFRIFENVLVFLIKLRSCRKIEKQKLKAKEDAEDLTQEMAELRYQITGMLEEEYKRRSCIAQAAIQQIQQLEVQVVKYTFLFWFQTAPVKI
mgnify:CR=1 FL=1